MEFGCHGLFANSLRLLLPSLRSLIIFDHYRRFCFVVTRMA